MSRCIISVILFMLISSSAMCQLSKWMPSAVRVGTDVGALGYMIFSDQRSYFEIEGDIDINNFFAVVDVGIDNYQISQPTYEYNNNERYMRIGLDVNFIKPNKNQNVAFFGVRYATSSFDDKLIYDTDAVIESETGWPNTTETATNTDAKGNWYELNTGLKVRVIRQLYLGFTARYKIGLSIKKIAQ